MSLQEAVRELRAGTRDSQQSFAQRLGLSMRAIANYEKDRAPNSPALYRLAKLARQVGRSDLAQIFSSALTEELHDVVEPMTTEEKVWSDAVIAVLRNRDLTDWPRVGRSIVRALESALETLMERLDDNAAEDLATVLVEARYSLVSLAEPQLDQLAQARQAKTGETYHKAYSEVLMENPELYDQYHQERADAARGTPFEKSVALPPGKKRGKSKGRAGSSTE
jgi:transcriptional regulator with XRE-family HTH domain